MTISNVTKNSLHACTYERNTCLSTSVKEKYTAILSLMINSFSLPHDFFFFSYCCYVTSYFPFTSNNEKLNDDFSISTSSRFFLIIPKKSIQQCIEQHFSTTNQFDLCFALASYFTPVCPFECLAKRMS